MGSKCVRQQRMAPRMAPTVESPLNTCDVLPTEGVVALSATDDAPLTSAALQCHGEGQSARVFSHSLSTIADVRALVEDDAKVDAHRVGSTDNARNTNGCDPQPANDMINSPDAADGPLLRWGMQTSSSLPPHYASLRGESVSSFFATPRSLRTVRTLSALSPARSQGGPFPLTALRFSAIEHERSDALHSGSERYVSLPAFCVEGELQQRQRCPESQRLHDEASFDDPMSSQGRCPAATGAPSVLNSLDSESVPIAVVLGGKPSCGGCSSFSTDCGFHSAERPLDKHLVRTCGSPNTPETRFELPKFREQNVLAAMKRRVD